MQSQSYGPEARGGMCKAETIISKDKIGFAKSIHPDFLLALTQQAFDRFMGCTSERAIILADADLKLEVKPEENKNVVFLPIIRTAYELVGRSVTANIVAVGAVNKLLGIFDNDATSSAVKRHIPKGTERLNELALKAGMELVDTEMAEKYRIKLL